MAGLGEAVKAAIKDAILTCGWMFFSSALGPAAAVVAAALGVEDGSNWRHVIFTCLIVVLIVVTDWTAAVLGGASFNPAGNASMYAAGVPGDTLLSMALRFPAQIPIRELGGVAAMAGTTTAAIKLAIGDGILTFMWVFCASTIGLFTYLIANWFGVQGPLTLVITTSIVAVLVFIFTFIGQILGGASFNPTGTAAFYAAGLGGDSLLSMAFRFPAQAAGAVGGAIAISEVMPSQYKHMLGGPSIKVDLHTAAMAEGVLTFLISLAVLIIILRIPGGTLIKTWLLAMATVTLVVVGSSYTGPSMNPANAFGWAYINNRHNTWDQFYVYWICPFIGAIVAAWVFRIIFPQPKKQKKAPKNKKAD